MELSIQDIVDYFAEKKINIHCTCCGNKESITFVGENQKLLPLNILTSVNGLEEFELRDHVKYIGLLCHNCGYTRLFQLGIIRQWVEAKKKFQH
jgi:predicted nucleic-acid-binding Zn-ribbon protein